MALRYESIMLISIASRPRLFLFRNRHFVLICDWLCVIELENLTALFLWRDSNDKHRRPLTVSVVFPLEAVNQQLYVGPDRFVISDVFLSVF